MFTAVRPIFHALSVATLPDVKPSPRVDAVFSRLVFTILHAPLFHKRLSMRLMAAKLRTARANSVFALEVAWAERILYADDAYGELSQFPSYKNYERLVAREWRMMTRQHPRARNIVFLGSGPLPLTSILLAKEHGCKVTLVDIDERAVSLSDRLIQKLGLSSMMRAVQADATTYQEVSEADVVYVAALVGTDPEVEIDVYKNMAKHLRRPSLLVVRSSYGNRTLLYRPVNKTIDRFFTRIAEVHPHDAVVNSSILFRPYA
jgi:nicotianamine synthase